MRLRPNCYATRKANAIRIASAILIALLCGQPSQTQALQISTSMPDLDPAKFIADDFSFAPIIVPFAGETCFDVNMKYMAFLQGRNYVDDRKRQLLVYELQSGQLVKSAQLPDVEGKLLTISTDFSALALDSRRRDKVEIWKLSDEAEDGAAKAAELEFEDRQFSWCKFIDESRLIVGENDGTVKAFSAAGGKELYEASWNVQRENRTNHRLGRVAKFTRDNRFLCFMRTVSQQQLRARSGFKHIVHVIDLEDGGKAAEIPLRVDDHYYMGSFHVSPNGKMFCTSLDSREKKMRACVAIWDAKTGKLLKQLNQPRFGLTQASWLTNDLLVSNDVIYSFREGRALVDLGDIRPVKTVVGAGQMVFKQSLGRHYQIVHPSPLAKHAVIFCQKLDEAAVRQAAKVEEYEVRRLFGGDSVALNFDFRARSPISNFEADFRKGIKDSLGKAGYIVDNSADVKLNVTVTENSTGKTVEYSKITTDTNLPVGNSYKVSEVLLNCDMRFVDRDGEFAKEGRNVAMPSQMIELAVSESVHNAIRKWRWESALQTAKHYRFYRSYSEYNLPEFTVEFAPDAAIVREKAEAAEAAAEVEDGGGSRFGMRGKAAAGRAKDKAKPNPIAGGKLRPLAFPAIRLSEPWKVKPFLLQPLASGTLRTPMSISGGDEDPDGVKLAYVKTKQAAVLLRGRSNSSTLYRYDLATRRMLAETSLRSQSKLMDFRLDGKYWVSTRGSHQSKFQIYKATNDDELQPDELFKEVDIYGSGDLVTAWLCGSDTLLVCRTESLVGYSISEEKKTFEKSIDVDMHGQPQVWVSADRSVFLQAAKGRIQLFRCTDSKIAGELPMVIDDTDEVLSVAFSPTGKRIAILKQGQLEIRNLTSGKLVQVVLNDDLKAPIQWCDENFVMSMNMLISLDLGSSVWQYGKKWTESPFLVNANQAGWYQAADETNFHYLVQVGTPNKQLYQQVGRYISLQTKLIKRGDALGVRVQLDGDWAEDNELKKRLTKSVEEQLTRSGYKVSGDVTSQVSIAVKLEETDELRQELRFSNGTKSVTVPDYLVTATVNVRSATGAQREVDRVRFYLSSIDYSLDMAAVDLKQELMAQCKLALVARITEPRFPAVVYQKGDHRLGQSELRDGREFPILSKKGKALVGE